MKYQTRRLDQQLLQHGLIAGLGLLVLMASTISAEAKDPMRRTVSDC